METTQLPSPTLPFGPVLLLFGWEALHYLFPGRREQVSAHPSRATKGQSRPNTAPAMPVPTQRREVTESAQCSWPGVQSLTLFCAPCLPPVIPQINTSVLTLEGSNLLTLLWRSWDHQQRVLRKRKGRRESTVDMCAPFHNGRVYYREEIHRLRARGLDESCPPGSCV